MKNPRGINLKFSSQDEQDSFVRKLVQLRGLDRQNFVQRVMDMQKQEGHIFQAGEILPFKCSCGNLVPFTEDEAVCSCGNILSEEERTSWTWEKLQVN